MAEMIEKYLESLRAELSGADPALIQDALYDADEFLRDATEGSEDPQAAFEEAAASYGTPAEVADAYREAEITVQKAMQVPVPAKSGSLLGKFFGVLADPRAWGALFYMALAFATGIAYFVITTVWLSVSVALLILIIGLPLLAMFLPVIRGISFMEGRLVEVLLGQRMPRRPRPFSREGGLMERVKSWLTDRRTWTTLLYMILQFPLGILYFVLLVTSLSLAAALVAAPILGLITGDPVFWINDTGYIFHPAAVPFVMMGGGFLFVIILHASRGIAKLHGAYAKAMLVGDFADV